MDRIIHATAGNSQIKMAVIDGRSIVQRAREIHNCSPTASAALGRTLCAASLMGNAMKEESENLTLRIKGNGPAGVILAVSDQFGNVKGYINDPSVDPPRRTDKKLNVGAAVGSNGLVTVSRDMGLKEPYVSSTALVSGEIAEDITAFLLESEQVPSACGLGVLVDTDTSIKAAGGFIVQLMPDADKELINVLESNINHMEHITTILVNEGAEGIFKKVLNGIEYHIVSESPVEYRCQCSRDRVVRTLKTMNQSEIVEMITSGENTDVVCDFCGTHYIFTPDDLVRLLNSRPTLQLVK